MNFYDNFSKNVSVSPLMKEITVPVFQNKVYNSFEEAVNAVKGPVRLVRADESGFVFNDHFDGSVMVYDEKYQNEQGNSAVFREHLLSVLELLKTFGIAGKKIVEVGCGKAVFFDKMLAEGFDCWGFDPTYEGSNPRIIKEYFSEKFNDIHAEVIILRHTLEHIEHPFTFLHQLAKANDFKGHLFVEVPTFDWIEQKAAFWDIFYEHCNYFTESSLAEMFEDSKTGSFFGGQYIYIWADLSKLKPTISALNSNDYNLDVLKNSYNHYKQLVNSTESFVVWGAGGKGSTFLNIIDNDRKRIKYVVDINPVKQFKYIGGTGHQIFPPSFIKGNEVENILVMNENYHDEIKELLSTITYNTINLITI
jgi:hypothetical protein